MEKISVEHSERTTIISITRPEVRNAVDGETARALAAAFKEFDADADSDVAVLYGQYGTLRIQGPCPVTSSKVGASTPNESFMKAE